MTFVESRLCDVKCHKRNDERYLIIFNVKSKKNNQTLVSDAYRAIPTLGSTDNAGNSVNLVSGIIRLPAGGISLSASEVDVSFYLYVHGTMSKNMKLR